MPGMGASIAVVVLLADAVGAVQNFVDVFIGVYVLLIFAYILTSWIRLPYSLSWLQRFLFDVCEPYLRIFRRLLPAFGPLDLSPIVGVFVLIILGRVIVRLLGLLH